MIETMITLIMKRAIEADLVHCLPGMTDQQPASAPIAAADRVIRIHWKRDTFETPSSLYYHVHCYQSTHVCLPQEHVEELPGEQIASSATCPFCWQPFHPQPVKDPNKEAWYRKASDQRRQYMSEIARQHVLLMWEACRGIGVLSARIELNWHLLRLIAWLLEHGMTEDIVYFAQYIAPPFEKD